MNGNERSMNTERPAEVIKVGETDHRFRAKYAQQRAHWRSAMPRRTHLARMPGAPSKECLECSPDRAPHKEDGRTWTDQEYVSRKRHTRRPGPRRKAARPCPSPRLATP